MSFASFNGPPPLIPPHKGEGELPLAKSPSPLWGGVRGGGNAKATPDVHTPGAPS